MKANDLRATAQQWMAQDPDPGTVDELRALLAAPDIDKTDLADRFAGSLEFGTAGLRGVLGAGPNRMNRAVVLRTTHGFASQLADSVAESRRRGVVVGYDGRRMSRVFAEDTAAVLMAQGFRVHLFREVGPTPLTAFAAVHLRAAAAVMVTASHNPPEYNGYKVYWENGAQIVPPVDGAIAARIETAPPGHLVPRLDLAEGEKRGLLSWVPDEVTQDYVRSVLALSRNPGGDRHLSIVYTPLHGVGDVLVRRVLDQAGFSKVLSVPEQQAPDGEFPTVAFPNPEEKGAMDLAFHWAKERRADLVIANDPDADRLAVAVPSSAAPSGFVQLTGNQVGVLLGHYLLTENAKSVEKPAVLASIVSSPMLGGIAKTLGAHYEETLTGFKRIANRAMELEGEGHSFVFGYEEALGYTVGSLVRDKDGVSAALLLAELAAVVRARGQSLLDRLADISREFGLYVSSQVTITKKGVSGVSELKALMTRIRESVPAQIGAHGVLAVADFETQKRRDRLSGTETPIRLPKTNMIVLELEGGARVVARPSGTEPKIKFYFDLREAVAAGEALAAAEVRAQQRLSALAEAFVGLMG